MALRGYPQQILLTTSLTSLLLLALGTSVAWLLYQEQSAKAREQSAKARELEENIGSQRAAVDLEDTVAKLIKKHQEGDRNVEPLHKDIETHLQEIDHFADKEPERILSGHLAESYHKYHESWQKGRPNTTSQEKLTHFLETCRSLRDFNARQIQMSGQAPEQALHWMAWGLAAVGSLGSLAWLLLGYGLARGLSRTIHQLRIQVRDAADRLSQELPAVVLMPEAGDDPLTREAGELVRQVEQVVQKLQQREREVRRAERLAAVGQLAAGVAHEIRNPLTSMKMLIQAGREDPQTGLSEEDLQVIEREIRRVERCLQTFLDFARPPRLERTCINLATLVERTLSLVRGRAEKQRVQVELERPTCPIEIEADAEQLQQVLVNLILNALDALPQGGKITVELLRPLEGPIQVVVRDTGAGIPPEVLPRMFEPFVSGKETGVGLGLVVSRRIVEDHGGILLGRNRLEGGAEFLFTLPCDSGEPGASAPGGRRKTNGSVPEPPRADASGSPPSGG